MRGELADDLCLVADDHIPLHQIFEFTDIARPGVLHHSADGVIRKCGRLLAVVFAVFAEEEFQEDRNLFLPLSQRRVEFPYTMRATTSLPDPLSPRMSTVTFVSATCSTVIFTSSIFGLVPKSMEKSDWRRTWSRNCVTSCTWRSRSRTRAMRWSRSFGSNGLGM